MKMQVELLSCLKYVDKKTNQDKVRIGYRCLDPKFRQDKANLKGYSELSVYLEDTSIFDKLKVEDFGIAVILEFTKEQSPNNPLRDILKLKSINVGSNVINIL